MRTRTKKLSAIGAAIGLILAGGVAVGPAIAAPAVKTAVNSTCSAFAGRTVTAQTATYTSIAMRGGDTITATVSPSRTGDYIRVTATMGLNILISEGSATSAYTWRAPADGVYNIGWAYRSPAGTVPTGLTWTFSSSCSNVSVSPSPSPTPTATTKPGKGKGK
jgi:hypothetical protein